jgi:hypothetical protein
MHMSDDKYRPRRIEELEGDPIPVTFVNEPIAPDNVIPLPKARSIHAVLVESLNHMRALLVRLEAGITVPRDQQREVVRELYVATRHQVQVLVATLELDGLE